MPYATPDQRRDYQRHKNAQRRLAGVCIQCGTAPATIGGRCQAHASDVRLRSRLYFRQQGHQPRYTDHPEWGQDRPYFNREWQRTYWEDDGEGQYWRVAVYWLDPLTLLLKREAVGAFTFMRDHHACV